MSKTVKKMAAPTFCTTSERPQAENSGLKLDIFGPNLGNYVVVHPLFELG